MDRAPLPPTLLLLTHDEELTALVLKAVKKPWKLVSRHPDRFVSDKAYAQRNVRLVIFDDQSVGENDRGWVLTQIRKHFFGSLLLYVAGTQTDHNERRARTNGAHYYVSKPLPPDPFNRVLQSFLSRQNAKETI